MGNDSIKLKRKPEKPIRRMIEEKIHLVPGMSLNAISRKVLSEHWSSAVFITGECCKETPESFWGVYKRIETNNELQVRMQRYNKQMKQYNDWYKEHRKEIEAQHNEESKKIKHFIETYLTAEDKRLQEELKTIRKEKEKLK